MGGWTSVYIADPDDSSTETMREIAKNAGVHFYSDENVPVYANQKLLCVHVAKGSKKTVSLKGKCKKLRNSSRGKSWRKMPTASNMNSSRPTPRCSK